MPEPVTRVTNFSTQRAMDRVRQIEVLIAAADEGGFASAARRLGMSPAAATRAVAALERRIGCALLFRSTRGVTLTDAGQCYVDDCRQILADIDSADDAAAGAHAQPRGHLVIGAPTMMGHLVLAPIVAAFTHRCPEVSIDLRLYDRSLHLFEERIDVALMAGWLPDSTLVAQPVGQVQRVLCAAPSYLDQFAPPLQPCDLALHRIVFSAADARTPHWRFVGTNDVYALPVRPHITVSTNQAAIALALAGAGLARVMSYQVEAEIARGALKALLTDKLPPPLPVHLVSREGRRAPAKVKLFFDFALTELRNHAALQVRR